MVESHTLCTIRPKSMRGNARWRSTRKQDHMASNIRAWCHSSAAQTASEPHMIRYMMIDVTETIAVSRNLWKAHLEISLLQRTNSRTFIISSIIDQPLDFPIKATCTQSHPERMHARNSRSYPVPFHQTVSRPSFPRITVIIQIVANHEATAGETVSTPS